MSVLLNILSIHKYQLHNQKETKIFKFKKKNLFNKNNENGTFAENPIYSLIILVIKLKRKELFFNFKDF